MEVQTGLIAVKLAISPGGRYNPQKNQQTIVMCRQAVNTFPNCLIMPWIIDKRLFVIEPF